MDWFDAFQFRVKENVNIIQEITMGEEQLKGRIKELCCSYNNIFDGEPGLCSSFKAHLSLKDNAIPKFFKCRPMPFSQLTAVKNEIDRLVNRGVLKQIKYSHWAARIVAIPKPNGSVRLCGDFKVTVKPQMLTEYYPIPRAEELFHRLQNCRYYKFMEQFIQDLPSSAVYLDDIVVSGKTEEEHLLNLETLFKRMSEAGLKCNLNKCKVLKKEIDY